MDHMTVSYYLAPLYGGLALPAPRTYTNFL